MNGRWPKVSNHPSMAEPAIGTNTSEEVARSRASKISRKSTLC
jgi:hypothetical protein